MPNHLTLGMMRGVTPHVLAVVAALIVQAVVLDWSQKSTVKEQMTVLVTENKLQQKHISDFIKYSTFKHEGFQSQISENKSNIMVLKSKHR